jgi:hypothetical protein
MGLPHLLVASVGAPSGRRAGPAAARVTNRLATSSRNRQGEGLSCGSMEPGVVIGDRRAPALEGLEEHPVEALDTWGLRSAQVEVLGMISAERGVTNSGRSCS